MNWLMEQTDARTEADRLLDEAAARAASDLHLEPEAEGYRVRFRTDGLLDAGRALDAELGRAIVTRLMVLAELLTYRPDIPQEGRLTVLAPSVGRTLQMRLAIIPTTHGLRAVVRMPAELSQPQSLDQLGLPEPTLRGLYRFAQADTGLLLLTGPAGSGKTTTIYALLQHIVTRQPGLSVIALEDPVERDLPGVTQVQVADDGPMSYQRALRSVLRQDPQVLMLGEIRDAETASIAVQAALSGHRLVATLHAGSPETAIARLLEMGLRSYQLTSALYGVLAQRLLRRVATDPATIPAADPAAHSEPTGTDASEVGRYRGRVAIAELATMDEPLRRAVMADAGAAELRRTLRDRPGYPGLRDAAHRAVEAGWTDEAEVHRVLGPAEPNEHEAAEPEAGWTRSG